jgi:hypothetical protein
LKISPTLKALFILCHLKKSTPNHDDCIKNKKVPFGRHSHGIATESKGKKKIIAQRADFAKKTTAEANDEQLLCSYFFSCIYRAEKRAAWRQARLKSLEQDAIQAQIMIQSLNSDFANKPRDRLDGVEEEEVS